MTKLLSFQLRPLFGFQHVCFGRQDFSEVDGSGARRGVVYIDEVTLPTEKNILEDSFD